MSSKTIGLLHPGEMGVTIGKAAGIRGARVIWASQQRSKATLERANQAGLHDVVKLSDLVQASDIILSVCPPHAALELAQTVAKQGFKGTYVDANAIATSTARRIGEALNTVGANFVDGGIIGRAIRQAGTTRLYLSGPHAVEVSELFSGSLLEAIPLGTEPGAASTLKMVYAAWTKGSNALLLAIRALAAVEGVEQALLGEWARSHPELMHKSDRAAERAVSNAWRYVAEMQEIAATFEAAGLPPGFHITAADIYERLASFKDGTDLPSATKAVIDTLRASAKKHRDTGAIPD